jgi:O-antigen/teichoic acid export membrane protein
VRSRCETGFPETTRIVIRVPSRVIKNLGSGLLAQAWTVLLGLVALPVLVRGLGAEHYGLLALSLALIGFAAVADLGVGRAASKFIAEDYERNEIGRTERFVRTSLTVSTGTGLIGTAGLLLLTPLLVRRVFNIRQAMQAEAQIVFALTAIGLVPVLLRILFDGVLAGHHRIAFLNLTNMIANTLKAGFSIAAIMAGHSVLAIVAINVVVCYLHAIGLGWYTHLFFCGRIRVAFGWDRKIARQLLELGLVSTLSWVLANVIFLYADRVIIGMFLPLAMVGYYTMAFDIASKQWYFSSSVSQTFLPVFSGQSVTNQGALGQSYIQAAKALAVLVTGATMLLVVFGRELLTYWISPDFAAHSTAPMMLLGIGILLSCYVTIPYTAIISASTRPAVCAAIFGGAIVVHVGASLWWLRLWSIMGVALAFAVAYAGVLVVSAWWVSRNLVKVPLSIVLTRCFAVPWIAAAAFGAACWFLVRPLIHSLIAVGAASILAYVLYLALCSMAAYNGEERRLGWRIGRGLLGLGRPDSLVVIADEPRVVLTPETDGRAR